MEEYACQRKRDIEALRGSEQSLKWQCKLAGGFKSRRVPNANQSLTIHHTHCQCSTLYSDEKVSVKEELKSKKYFRNPLIPQDLHSRALLQFNSKLKQKYLSLHFKSSNPNNNKIKKLSRMKVGLFIGETQHNQNQRPVIAKFKSRRTR